MNWTPISILLKDAYGNVYGAIAEDVNDSQHYRLYLWIGNRLAWCATVNSLDAGKRIVMALACGHAWPRTAEGTLV